MVNRKLPKKNDRSVSEALKRAMEAVQRDALMEGERNRGATFRLNSGFVRTVEETYCAYQANLLLEDGAKQNPKEMPTPGLRQPFPKGRLIKHVRPLLEEAFWASLRTEEGRWHKFELTYEPQGESGHRDPIVFDKTSDKPLLFNSETLAKLAPALHSTQVIGVWPSESATAKGKLVIWGFAQKLWGSSLSLKTIDPGKIIVSFGFSEKAGLDGQRADFVSEYALRPLREWFRKTHRYDLTPDADQVEAHSWADRLEDYRLNDLAIIARTMRAHRNGGALLLVRDYDKDVVDVMRYPVKPDETLKAYLESRDILLREGRIGRDSEDFLKLLESIGQLTAVDGATMVTYDLGVLGFGAKLKPNPGGPEQFCLHLSGPFENSKPKPPCSSSDMAWGTRHRSAARFIADKHDALAIVASQDGKLSVFLWDDAQQAVSVTEEAEFLLL